MTDQRERGMMLAGRKAIVNVATGAIVTPNHKTVHEE
jgi:hypothetical protein